MEKAKAIEALNSLVIINNDRIEGYQTASDTTDEQELKIMFTQFISTSAKCRQELISEVNAMGGEKAKGTKVSGKFFRTWMDVKAALTGKDRKAILNSCDNGEEKAKDAYEDVLENEIEHLTVDQKNMVIAQNTLLRGDHQHVIALRDALVDA